MKKKIFVILFIIICCVGVGYMIVVNTSEENENILNEYIPEVEISDDEIRKTEINLYFMSSEDASIKIEVKKIDSKKLLREPYLTILGLLAEGPSSNELESVIPQDTKILETTINKGCLTINFSKEFVENAPEDEKKIENMIYCIVNTLTELNEVESVKFLIEGESVEGFEGNNIKLTEEYFRKNIN
jgi:spore germination protein GerM